MSKSQQKNEFSLNELGYELTELFYAIKGKKIDMSRASQMNKTAANYLNRRKVEWLEKNAAKDRVGGVDIVGELTGSTSKQKQVENGK